VPVVTTGTITTPVLGAWRRLSLISSDGSLAGLDIQQLFGRLEEFGIPAHQHPFARTLLSWRQARIPPDAAFALWLIRQRQDADGCIYRLTDSPICEGGPAIRYVQLATAVGEDLQTDSVLRKAVQWLLDQQLSDGSISDLMVTERGEAGSTARTLRALSRLRDPSLAEPLARMSSYLERTAVKQMTGVGWPQREGDSDAVVAATSLATLALIESESDSALISEALDFLLSAQNPSGGWPAIRGYEDSLQSTFNAMRTILAAKTAGILNGDLSPVLASTRKWLLHWLKHRPPQTTIDIAFALRLVNLLDLLHLKPSERLAIDLLRRRRQTLSANADLYADTEIMALALVECSHRLDQSPLGYNLWPWRWALPALPPPFLVRAAHFYEVLYGAFRARWWLRTVDFIARASLVEGVAGLLLGVIAALGVVDGRLTSAFTFVPRSGRSVVATVSASLLVLLWLGVRAAARSAAESMLWTSAAALAIALTVMWILDGSGPTPRMVPVIAVYWLIIDVVSFTADRSGLLDRLLPH
jgi:prenyltransferase beta subunit